MVGLEAAELQIDGDAVALQELDLDAGQGERVGRGRAVAVRLFRLAQRDDGFRRRNDVDRVLEALDRLREVTQPEREAALAEQGGDVVRASVSASA